MIYIKNNQEYKLLHSYVTANAKFYTMEHLKTGNITTYGSKVFKKEFKEKK